uniref:tRNA (uracil-O(2)-)-methyltransferase n=1 Tax=Lutzomyia longipalpis TaxID=7200 RepID=A0A1B0CTG8_LUTLO
MNLCERIVKKVPLVVEHQSFWSTILFHAFGQHILNRRISGGVLLGSFEWLPEADNLKNVLPMLQKQEDLTKNGILGCRENFKCMEIIDTEEFQRVDVACLKSCILAFELLGKSRKNPKPFLVVFIDVTAMKASFFTYQHEQQCLILRSGYYLSYNSHHLELGVYSGSELDDGDSWFKFVFSRFVNMMTNPKPTQIRSLSLVGIEPYSRKYQQLKEKYGEDLVKGWLEVTDPQKYVFEDIAIAAYLLVLWEMERKRLEITTFQSFIDVGCGNGLLVYILTSEGHPGMGIDLRKRNIWEKFPSNIRLTEKTLNPKESNELEPTDWIIGNHSDEMSPWIPVLAAKNSPNCRFFLLPCCAYEFSGMKFQRRDCKLSVYQDFLKYTERISEICGISTQRDRLRIPSTKRVCIVGYARDHFDAEDLGKFIENESCGKFQARESVEKVRNCTQLPKNITNQIVEIVFRELLNTSSGQSDPERGSENWNAGGVIDLPELAEKIPQDLLTALKAELVQSQVKIRDPRKVTEDKRNPKIEEILVKLAKKFKEKDCWFFVNHPNGCPLANEDCTYRHEHEK